MSAKATGSNTSPNGSAQSRTHHDGSSSRAFTVEQKAAVIRIKRCGATAYYEILGLESIKTSCTDSDIKKAYRKLSLLTHPDKNGYQGADEAFKLVSKAFQVLSDPDKKKKFDAYGGDPDARFNPASTGGGGGSPFPGGGFAQRGGFAEEMTPEELFRQFFGGGFGGPFGAFDTGPGFVFNIGGGPGVRVHQFGGGQPRRRPRPDSNEAPQSAANMLANLLPLLLLFILPLLTSLFSSSSPSFPNMTFDSPRSPYTEAHKTNLNVQYFVDPRDVHEYSRKQWRELDRHAEQTYVHALSGTCQRERIAQAKAKDDAYGWFGVDQEALDKARKMDLPSCRKLKKMGVNYQ